MEAVAYHSMADLEDRHWWFVARRKIIAETIKTKIDLPPGARILEAGCGTGGNIAFLRTFGSVEAMEYDDFAREYATSRSGLGVRAGSLPDRIPSELTDYDLIALLDVLEHVEQDRASLEALANRLARGGMILLTVPALQFLWSSHDVVHHHHRRYSKKRLLKVIDAAGLSTSFITYFNSLLFPAALLQRGFSKLMRSDARLDAMPTTPVNSLLTRAFSAEAAILKHMSLPVGLSLLAVCQKT